MTDHVTIKQRQQQTWATGDFSAIGATTVIVAERLCDAVDLRSGQQVLDVACGSGNAALAAARRFTEVTGVDFVPALLERGRERAAAERLPVTLVEGDAEAIPFPDAAFDRVLSVFGVMFAPDQEQAARELLRVCRPGGRIGLANWTPDGFIGAVFRVTAGHVPPPAGLRSPMLWAEPERLRELFGQEIVSLEATPRQHFFRFHSPRHWLDFFRTWYGPTMRAFGALDASGQAALERDLLAVAGRFNRSGDATLVAPGDYLEVVATRG